MKKRQLVFLFILIFIIASPLYAKSKLVETIGIGIGGCLPQGGWDPGFTALAQANMGEAIKYLYFSPYLSYARAEKSEEFNDKVGNLSIQYLSLGIKMVGYINSKPKGFYLGGTLSYNLIYYDEIEWAEFSQNTQITSANTTKLGLTGLAGYLFMLQNIAIFIETDYMFTTGGYNILLLTAGLNFNL